MTEPIATTAPTLPDPPHVEPEQPIDKAQRQVARPPGARFANLVRWLAVIALAGTASLSWWRSNAPVEEHEHKEGPYTCPMHPTYLADIPGNCPICGMDLVPVASLKQPLAADPTDFVLADLPGVRPVAIATERLQRAGVHWHPVKHQDVRQTFSTLGVVRRDPTQSLTVEARTAGWLEHVAPLREGDVVRKGQTLARLFSREVQLAEAELAAAKVVDAMQAPEAALPSLQSSARRRLQTLGGSGKSSRGQSYVVAPRSGTVLSWSARRGSYVAPGQALGVLGDLLALQIEVEVPPEWALQVGDEVAVAWQAEVRSAAVDQVLAVGGTGVGRLARLTLLPVVGGPGHPAGPEHVGHATPMPLAPWPDGAVVQVTKTVLRPGALVVPRSAVMQEGEHAWVYRRAPSGRMWPIAVTLGVHDGAVVEVLAGLAAGNEVVTHGRFLVDAESRRAPPYVAPPQPAAAPPAAAPPAPAPPAAATAVAQPPTASLSAAGLTALLAATEAMAADDEAGTEKALRQLSVALPGGLPFAPTLPEARKGWHAWTLQLWPVLQQTPAAQSLHVAWCPMAKGRWLQKDKVIANPYFGAKMLRCGDIIGTVATVPAQPTAQEAE
jgi:Cu(I)/Ag(I) efflux system membrane fusion protein